MPIYQKLVVKVHAAQCNCLKQMQWTVTKTYRQPPILANLCFSQVTALKVHWDLDENIQCMQPRSCSSVQCISTSPFLIQVFTILAQNLTSNFNFTFKILIIIPIFSFLV